MALKVGELFASFNLDTSGVGGAIRDAERQLGDLGKGLQIGGAAMTAAVTVPVQKAAKEIYEAGSGFDASMSKVFAIAGDSVTGSVETMEALRTKALEMGSTTAFTASEAAEAFQYMAMAGWKSEAMLEGIEPIMNLAAASGEELGTVSDIVTDALTAFGLTAADTAHFTDVLAAASSNSNTNVAIMGESFKYVAPLAGSLGYSVDDVAVALGLMANAGIKGSMAGTSLRQIFSNLIHPTEDQAKAIEAFGVSLFDSNGKVKDFNVLMKDLRQAAKASGFDMKKIRKQVAEYDAQLDAGLITEDEYNAKVKALTEGGGDFLAAITELAGTRGLSGLLAIMNASDEDFNNLTQAVDKSTGAAKRMAEVMLDNAKGDVTLFKSAVEGLEITLWELADGPFRKIVQQATSYVDAFRKADKSTQLGAVRLAGLAAAIGPAMLGMGSFLRILPALAHSFSFLASPVAMLGLGFVALGAAAIDTDNTIGKTLEKSLPAVGKKLSDLGKKAKSSTTKLNINVNRFLASLRKGITEGLPGMMDGVGDLLSVVIDTLGNSLPMVGNVMQTLIRTLAEGISRNLPQLVPAVVNLLKNLATTMISNAPVVLEGFGTIITGLFSALGGVDWGEVGDEIGTGLRTAVSEIGTWFKKFAMGDKYVEDAGWDQVGMTLIENLKDGMSKGFGNVKDFVGKLVLGKDYDPNEKWGTVGTKIVEKIFDVGDKALAFGSQFVYGIIDGIAGLFSTENIDAASESIKGIIQRILERAAGLISGLGEVAAQIISAIGDVLFGKNKEGKSVVTSGVKALTDIVRTIFETISTKIIPNLGDAVKMILTSIGNLFTEDNGKALGTGLAELVTSIITGLTDAIVALADTTTEIVEGTETGGVVSAAQNIFGELLGAIVDGIAYALPKLGEVIPKLIRAFAGLFSEENLNKAFETFGRVVEGVEDSGLIDMIVDAIGNILEAVIDSLGTLVGYGATLVTKMIELLGKIFTPENISKAFETAGTLFDRAADSALGSGGLLDTVLDAVSAIFEGIGNLLSRENLDAVITGVKTLVQNLLARIKDVIESGSLTTFITDIIGAVGTVLSNLAGSTGSILSGASDLAVGIMDAIIAGIKQLPNIASKLFDALSDALANLADSLNKADGFADGQAAGKTVGEFTGALADAAGNLNNGGGLTRFIENLVNALFAALKYGAGHLGGFLSELLGYILSPKGLEDFFNLGWNLVKLIFNGVKSAVSSLWQNLGNVIVNGLNDAGDWIYDHLPDWGKEIMEKLGFKYGAEYYEGPRDLETLYGSTEASFDAIYKSADNFGDKYATFIDNLNEDESKRGVTTGWSGMSPEQAVAMQYANYIKGVREAWQQGNFPSLKSEEEAIAKARLWYLTNVQGWTAPGAVPVEMPEIDYKLEPNASQEEQAEAAGKAAAEALGVKAQEAAQETAAETTIDVGDITVAGAVTGTVATEGLETELHNGTAPVADAAAEVSDAVVQAYLLRLNYDNAAAIATNWLSGLSTTLSADTTGAAAMDGLANTVIQAAQTRLGGNTSWTIGFNFAQGLASGIRAGMSLVIGAVLDVADAAINTLNTELEIGSPSKLTAQTGGWFDQGFANGILDSARSASEAAASLGQNAAYALRQSYGGMAAEATNALSMPVPARTVFSPAAPEQNAHVNAAAVGAAVANALNGAVVELDGEVTGHLLVPRISEEIAMSAAGRRYGTE